jgi:hypothetical protein
MALLPTTHPVAPAEPVARMSEIAAEPGPGSVAAKRAALVTAIYSFVPEGGLNAIDITGVLQHFPRGGPSRGSVRAWLMRLSRAGLVIKTRSPSSARGGDRLLLHRREAVSADELILRLWPPRAPRASKGKQIGKACPNILTVVSNWYADEFGLPTRTVTGTDAPEETIAPMQAAGRAGGMASARARKATKPAKPVLSSPASIGSP